MSHIKKILKGSLVAVCALFLLSTAMSGLAASPVTAKASPAASKIGNTCNTSIFGVPAWYNGIATKDPLTGHCGAIVSPSVFGPNGLQIFIFIIVLNLITVLLLVAGYVCVIFVIYGGFKYYFSTGTPEGMSKAKQTIMNAFIGLIISFLSVGIVNAIAGIVK